MPTWSLSSLIDAIVASLGLTSPSTAGEDVRAGLRLPDVDKGAAVTLPIALNAGVNNMYAGHRSHSSHSSHSSHASHYSGSGGSASPSSSSSDTSDASTAAPAPLISPQAQPRKPSADELKMMIMRVQAGLFSRNYDPGAIDGVLSESTKAAIRRYQADKHLSVTGTLTTELLNSLGIRAQ